MISIKPFGIILIAFCFAFSNVRGQGLPVDSLSLSAGVKNAIGFYNSAIGEQSEIYNGADYDLYPPAKKGSYYFLDKNYAAPSLIRYNGTWYKNVPVIYDIYNDYMVAAQRDSLFILTPGKVSDVYLLDHHFTYLATGNPENLKTGFYDIVYSGRSEVLIKRTKIVIETTVGSVRTEITYNDGLDIYIKKANRYYQVNSKSDFLDVFKEKKKDLNQYLKDNKINYKEDKENAVTRLAGYYDSLVN